MVSRCSRRPDRRAMARASVPAGSTHPQAGRRARLPRAVVRAPAAVGGLTPLASETVRADAAFAVLTDTASALVLLQGRPVTPTDPAGSGLVPRTRLVRQLMTSDTPIALVVAPAGYGKSTLISEWETRDERPFQWLSSAAEAIAAVEQGARS